MKTILVPIDFSQNSINALEYAGHLAQIFNARIILLHVYDIPISERKVASPIITLEEIESKIYQTCELFASKLHQQVSQQINVEYIIKKGQAVEEINRIVIEKEADLIVMGIVGMSAIDELIVGSVASATMRSVHCPVLVVPINAKFRKIEKIVFALDKKELSGSRGLSLLKEMASFFNAKVLVLNVLDQDDSDNNNSNARINLPAIFVNDIDHSISFFKGENVVNGIHDFAQQNEADLIAMIPHKYSALERIFNMSKTKEVAFHTNIPLLTLPDEMP